MNIDFSCCSCGRDIFSFSKSFKLFAQSEITSPDDIQRPKLNNFVILFISLYNFNFRLHIYKVYTHKKIAFLISAKLTNLNNCIFAYHKGI